MPLSETAQKALNESAKISNTKKKQKQAKEAELEAQRKKAENDYNEFVKQQAEIEQQLAEIEEAEALEIAKIKALEDKQQADLIARQAEEERTAQIIAQKQQAREAQLEPLNQKYQELEQEKARVLEQHATIYYTDANLDGIPDGGQRATGKGSAQYRLERDNIIKNYSVAQNKISQQIATQQQSFALDDADLPEWVKAKARREWNPTDFYKTSAVTLAKNYYESFEARAEFERQSSITTARSNAIKEREKLEITKREFETKRDSVAKELNKGQLKLKSIQEQKIQISSTRRPEIKDSDFFRDDPSSVIPDPIIGTTKENSNKAYATYALTQAQQRKLFHGVTTAQDGQEAINIKSRYQESNAYVGTPNTYLKGGQVKESYGVLIEKKLDKKFDTNVIPSEKAHPKAPVTIFNPLSDAKAELVERGDIIQPDNKIPEYVFLDDQGNTKKTSLEDIWKYNEYLLSQTPQLPSDSDKKLNQYMNENAEAISKVENKDERHGSAFPILSNFPFEKAFLDHGTELRATVSNINKPEGQREEFEPTLEARAFDDVLTGLENQLGGQPQRESTALKYLEDKAKTPEGQTAIAGSIAGSLAVLASTTIFPPLAWAKYSAKFIRPKTMKIAEEIATKLRVAGRDPETEKMLTKFPTMPETMKQQIRNKNGKAEIVGIEMLDDRTALIKRGTELNEVKSPYVVVKNKGKNPRATVYETYDLENPGQFREILISGKQGKELKGGQQVKGDIYSYPATVKETIKTPKGKTEIKVNQLETVSENKNLATVGRSEKVGLEGLKENPKNVISKLEDQPIKTGTVIQETERISQSASTKGTKASKEAGDKYKGDLGSKEFDYRVTPKDGEIRLKAEGRKSTTKLNDALKDTTKKIDTELPPTSKGTSGTVTKDPVKTRKEKLEKIIRQTEKESPSDYKILSASASISLATNNLRTQTIDLSKSNIKQATNAIQATQSGIKTRITTKEEIITGQKEKIKAELQELQKTKPALDSKYSLLVDGKQQTKTGTVPKYVLETVQKQKVTIVPDTPIKTPGKTPPVRPGFTISLDFDDKKEISNKPPKGKKGVGYWRWNTNTDEVGRYLPTKADLYTGKTRKVISKIDALERKVNSPGYKRKESKKEKRNFKKALQVFSNKKGSLESRDYIPNVSTPKGKQAKKFLKKFKINFGF